MKVLVTGGAGFIGSHIVDALLLRGHEVVIMDDYSSGRRENVPAGVLVYQRDVAGAGAFAGLPLFDAICHQAAQPSLRRSIDEPAYDAMVNVVGTLNVIQAARQCGAHVVFASTSAVYDPAGGMFTEASEIKPNLPYGIAKATAERYLAASGISHTILRYGNVYGPRQVPVGENQLIPHALAHIFDGQPFVINGDGAQARDFVYVEDIARANVLALETRAQGVFNCGTGKATAVNEVLNRIAMLTLHTPWFDHGPAKAGEARHVALNSTRARRVLGWAAETPLEGGLKWTIAAWRERA